MDCIRLESQTNAEKMENALKKNQTEMNAKLAEMEKRGKLAKNELIGMMNKQQIKMDSLNTKYFQTFFEQNYKKTAQNCEYLMNECKQDLKRELDAMKNDISSQINKSQNGMESEMDRISVKLNKFGSDLKYQIKKICKDDLAMDVTSTTNQTMIEMNDQYERLFTAQSEKMNTNGKLLRNLQQTMPQLVKDEMRALERKLIQICNENTVKTSQTIKGLSPLFQQIMDHFDKISNGLSQNIESNNHDLTQSFNSYKSVKLPLHYDLQKFFLLTLLC